MKKILTILILFIGFIAHAQLAPNPTTALETANTGQRLSIIDDAVVTSHSINFYGLIGIDAIELSKQTAHATGGATRAYGRGATGANSIAMGVNTWAEGEASTVMGTATRAQGDNSTATGSTTHAEGIGSSAMGFTTHALGTYSTAMGDNTHANGINSTAMGNTTTASGLNSTAMGQATTATGKNSTAMGFTTTAGAYGSLAIGQFNIAMLADDPTGHTITDTAFVIGNGTSGGTGNLSNAFRVDFNGNTEIEGNTEIKGTAAITGTTTINTDLSLAVAGNNATISNTAGNLAIETGTGSISLTSSGADDATPDLILTGENTTLIGELTVTGDVVVNSDMRLKANIISLGSTLYKLLQIDGKTYTMKRDATKKQKIGVLAQDIEKVFPELVVESNGIKSVNYQGLVPVLINSIKEQDAKISRLEKLVEKLISNK